MPDDLNIKRLEYFKRVQKETPDDYREDYVDSILIGKIIHGMTPYEAYLAGGSFSYRVKADKKVWRSGTDAVIIMWMQTIKPDNSEITMTFMNKTQYNTMDLITFDVNFEEGLCTRIEKKA